MRKGPQVRDGNLDDQRKRQERATDSRAVSGAGIGIVIGNGSLPEKGLAYQKGVMEGLKNAANYPPIFFIHSPGPRQPPVPLALSFFKNPPYPQKGSNVDFFFLPLPKTRCRKSMIMQERVEIGGGGQRHT